MICNTWRRGVARFITTAIIAAAFIQSHTQAASLFTVTADNGQINEIDADTGTLIRSFATPIAPQSGGGSGLAHSGSALYFSDITTATLYRLDPNTGAVLGTFAHPLEASDPQGASIDALGFGVTSYGPTLFTLNYTVNRVSLLNPLTGSLFSSYVSTLDLVGGMDFHAGRNSLFVSGDDNMVFELEPSTGTLLNSFSAAIPSSSIQVGVGIVGGRLFTAPQFQLEISERDPATGAVLNSIPSPGGPASALAGAYVPEPSSASLAVMSAFAALAFSSRRRA